MYSADILLEQLAALGRQLDVEVAKLGELDMISTGLGCEYNRLREEHEDNLADAFLGIAGGVEARKTAARLKCVPSRLLAQRSRSTPAVDGAGSRQESCVALRVARAPRR